MPETAGPRARGHHRTRLEVSADRQTFVEPVFLGARSAAASAVDDPMPAALALAVAQALQRLGQATIPDSE